MIGSTARRRRSAAKPDVPRGRMAVNVVLILIALLFVVPLLWLVLSSVDSHATYQTHLAKSLSLSNFAAVLNVTTVFLPLLNSLLIGLGVAIICVVVSVLAAYPLSRYKLRFGQPFLVVVLFSTCLPVTAIMVPVYQLFVQFNLLDNRLATVFFLAATALPTSIFMMKNFMDGVPIDVEEAAWTDGASRFTALRLIVVPLMRPGIAVVFIFTFIESWGNFFAPFVLLLSPDKLPLSVSIYSFFGQNGLINYGQLAAFSILYAAPVLGLYLIVSRGIGGSFALAGAVKG